MTTPLEAFALIVKPSNHVANVGDTQFREHLNYTIIKKQEMQLSFNGEMLPVIVLLLVLDPKKWAIEGLEIAKLNELPERFNICFTPLFTQVSDINPDELPGLCIGTFAHQAIEVGLKEVDPDQEEAIEAALIDRHLLDIITEAERLRIKATSHIERVDGLDRINRAIASLHRLRFVSYARDDLGGLSMDDLLASREASRSAHYRRVTSQPSFSRDVADELLDGRTGRRSSPRAGDYRDEDYRGGRSFSRRGDRFDDRD